MTYSQNSYDCKKQTSPQKKMTWLRGYNILGYGVMGY